MVSLIVSPSAPELRHNVPSYDNGPALQSWIEQGRLLPSGVFYFSTQIVLNDDCSYGHARGPFPWLRHGAVIIGRGTVLVWVGSAGTPAILIDDAYGVGLHGINLWRCFYPDSSQPENLAGQLHTGTGIRMQYMQQIDIQRCSFCGWNVALHSAPSNNCDCSCVTNCRFNGNATDFLGNEPQGSEWDWRGIWIGGGGTTVFDFGNSANGGGGNWKVTSMVLNEPRTIMRGQGGFNTASYTFENLKIDNNATGFSMIDWSGYLNLKVQGHFGGSVTPAAGWVTIAPHAASDYSIEFWKQGNIYPVP